MAGLAGDVGGFVARECSGTGSEVDTSVEDDATLLAEQVGIASELAAGRVIESGTVNHAAPSCGYLRLSLGSGQ